MTVMPFQRRSPIPSNTSLSTVVYRIIFTFLMKSNNSIFSRINLNTLSIFYAQYDNKASMYKLAVKVIDDVNSACAGSHLYSHGIYFYSAIVSILDCRDEY
jgi:hypothetical protein